METSRPSGSIDDRRLWGMVHDMQVTMPNLSTRFRRKDPRVKLQACSMMLQVVRKSNFSHLDEFSFQDSLIFFNSSGGRQEVSLKQLALVCILISSKIFDARPVNSKLLNLHPYFTDVGANHIASLELQVLTLLDHDVSRPLVVLLYDEAMSLADEEDEEDDDSLAVLSCRVLDVLYIFFSGNEGLGVLANVPFDLLANAVYAAAFSLVICNEVEQPLGSLLYCLAAHQRLAPFWTVADLQLVANVLLDNVLTDAQAYRFKLVEEEEPQDVNNLRQRK
ncbi:hypothetical protein GUITHDRAFT_120845 [Guillardia theta CCMP2712]|uniref:Uncharacterized protein n=1 Tax=Guillardia theta (strain CCMP2712) TaxID=905079 RepID=L1IA44_GUITC|nr:hypothetical protein GUITHDRAFT_120845 [Guillardia theta CCMP2712]EKX32967.1 hypothetical protein GUITHDRAFT_120845 [Guillardia theta CCMP2712]|eukprot:XP_005819947.1 hypothetical protein GUITHDRAFT_120845 [Guillardia theta CCMP2712]